MNKKSVNFKSSFNNAFTGFFSALKSEKNLRFHLLATTTVVCFGLICNISRYEWIAIFITIALVIISELFNTAVELSVDYFSPGKNPTARRIKDISASAVLISAIFSVIIGILIFGPKILIILGFS